MSLAPAGRIALKGGFGALSLDAAFDLAPGLTVITGPSGSGKSTLLRAIAGLERFDGRVQVQGEVWQDRAHFRPPHLRPVGYAFQHAALLPHLSVRGNLAYACRRSGAGQAALETVVDVLALSPLLDAPAPRLSGGERQRVALGRALLTRPRLLLLDEPVSAIDAAARTPLLERLFRHIADLGAPMLYVTHEPGELVHRAATTLVMQGGRIGAS